MSLTPDEQRKLAVECGYVDTPTVILAYQGFKLTDYTTAVEAKERETGEDMADVGRALMAAIETYADTGWHPADCLSEIVGDLHNAREELREEVAELTRRLAEQQAVFDRIAKTLGGNGIHAAEKTELNTLLAKERERCVVELLGSPNMTSCQSMIAAETLRSLK